jgi:D-glycero-D-manno-heptose 1,7-bisphosphate phosphatase
MTAPLRRAAFLDRDGVVNVDRGYVCRREDFVFVPGVLEACAQLRRLGLALVVVTNQSGIGRGLYSEDDYRRLTEWMVAEFAAAGAPLAGVYHCPHHPQALLPEYRRVCDCRKPAPGLLLAAARELSLDLSRSVLFGDKPSDIEAAVAAGVPQRVLLGTDGRALPPADLAPQATARFASLADAVRSGFLRAAMSEGAHA